MFIFVSHFRFESMRVLLAAIYFLTLVACTHSDSVQVGGRFDVQDSVVRITANNREFTFPLDGKNFFSGKIGLERATYASMDRYGISLFLSPGEDLEINVNSMDFGGTLQFRGTLGAINNYLYEREIENELKFKLFDLDEEEFVKEMQNLIREKILLLEAKNFGETFSDLERERIKYVVAGWALYYPSFHRMDSLHGKYVPGPVFDEFVSGFSLDNGDLIGSRDFSRYVLNYIYYKGRSMDIRELVNYVLENIHNQTIKNYLLSEVIMNHVTTKGLRDSDYLLSLCWKEVTDTAKISRIERLVDRWRRLSAGATAPDFGMMNQQGEEFSLRSFAGQYVYVYVWATWNEASREKFEALRLLQEKFKEKKIRFVVLSLDDVQLKHLWEKYIVENNIPGEHYILQKRDEFCARYMAYTFPRFLLIDPMGKIITPTAPAPDGTELLFKTLDL